MAIECQRHIYIGRNRSLNLQRHTLFNSIRCYGYSDLDVSPETSGYEERVLIKASIRLRDSPKV